MMRLTYALLFLTTYFAVKAQNLDVLSYEAFIHPDFKVQSIEGSVIIHFKTGPNSTEVVFDSGDLKISKYEGIGIENLEQKGQKTILGLTPNDSNTYFIKLFYTGNPTNGMKISSNPEQLYTVYFTSDWMICNMAPDDKALLKLDIEIPNHLTCVASGVSKGIQEKNKTSIIHSWAQDYETPAYTYGMAIGSFQTLEATHKDKTLKYFGANYSPKRLDQIFHKTGRMIDFFEDKTGISLPQNTYSQVLIGTPYQEMSGFSILKESYGRLIFKDSTETNLISHELAHQWWGNRITCKSWNHFWLNEAMATFMSAAMNEHLFGSEKYQSDINSYLSVYRKIKKKGADKPLVFPTWNNPTSDDRNMVYFKGAYVLHLLRQKMGEDSFWKGIKHYTQKHWGKSVITKDFQMAMEEVSDQSLTDFFDQWIY